MSGPATADQLLATVLSFRVFCQSASNVPSCIHLSLPLTRSTKKGLPMKVHCSNKPRMHKPKRLILSYNNPRNILVRFPVSDNPLHCITHCASSVALSNWPFVSPAGLEGAQQRPHMRVSTHPTDDLYDLYDLFLHHDLDLSGQI